jgi:hypothetical protein
MKPAEDGRKYDATRVLDGAMGRSGAECRGATRARNGHTAALFASKCRSFRFAARSYSRPKPRRFPLDRGFLRSAQGQSGDEASAGHSLAVARTRYIKGRQALREKYITTGRSIEMVACIIPDGHPRSTAAIQSAHPPNLCFVHCSVSLTKLHGLPNVPVIAHAPAALVRACHRGIREFCLSRAS